MNRLLLVSTLATLVCLLATPLSLADHAALDLASVTPPDRLQPGGPAVAVPIVLEVSCAGNGTLAASTARLALVSAPSWVDARFDEPVLAWPETACAQTPLRVEGILKLGATREAPAFRPDALRLSATVEPNEKGGNHSSIPTAVEDVVVEAAYFRALAATLEAKEATGRPQDILTFPLRLHNGGNALTRVQFEVVEKPAGWSFVLPPPVTLESAQQGGVLTEATIPLTVITPHRFGYLAEGGEVKVLVRSFPVERPDLVETYEVSFEPSVEGFSVPAPGVVALLCVLVGGAFVARGLRR